MDQGVGSLRETAQGYYSDRKLFDYRTGVFARQALPDWLQAAETLEGVVAERGAGREQARISLQWLAPVLAALESLPKGAILDVGCGDGLLLDACGQQGYTQTIGIDRSAVAGHVCHQCDVLDIASLRGVARAIGLVKGPMVVTEVLEHLRGNPLPMLVLLCENCRPTHLVFTAPNIDFPARFLMQDWAHYRNLPTVTRGAGAHGIAHVKPWTLGELMDLVSDLGYQSIGGFSGLWRVGIVAECQS